MRTNRQYINDRKESITNKMITTQRHINDEFVKSKGKERMNAYIKENIHFLKEDNFHDSKVSLNTPRNLANEKVDLSPKK